MTRLHDVNLGVPPDGADAEAEFLVGVLGYRKVEPSAMAQGFGARWYETDDGTQVHLSLDPDHRHAERAHTASRSATSSKPSRPASGRRASISATTSSTVGVCSLPGSCGQPMGAARRRRGTERLSARVLLVCWESAERDLVETLMRRARRPRWRGSARLDNGARSIRPTGFGDDAAWMSFCTGVGVEEHRRCYRKVTSPSGHGLHFSRRNNTPHPSLLGRARARGCAGRGDRRAVIDGFGGRRAGRDRLDRRTPSSGTSPTSASPTSRTRVVSRSCLGVRRRSGATPTGTGADPVALESRPVAQRRRRRPAP